MLDPRWVLVWVLKGAWPIREEKSKSKEKQNKAQTKENISNWRKWIWWNRITWNDGSRIELKKCYKGVKNVVEKIKDNMIKKTEKIYFSFSYSSEKKEA